jgi:hypothetical protein
LQLFGDVDAVDQSFVPDGQRYLIVRGPKKHRPQHPLSIRAIMTHRIHFHESHDLDGKTVDIAYVKRHLSTACPDRLSHPAWSG